jgi:hypothetical protein
MAGLTQAQRERICDYLWEKIAAQRDTNIVGVGFGPALKDREIDLMRPAVIRFYVRKKQPAGSRTKPRFPIGKTIRVPLALADSPAATGGKVRLPWATFPTDVHEVGELVATGRQLTVDGDPSRVTGGSIVRWLESGDASPHWGIVTVAHGFKTPIDPGSLAGDTAIVNPKTGDQFRGLRLLQFRPPVSGMDVCLVGVAEGDLLAHGLVGTANQAPQPVRSYQQLGSDVGVGGLSRQIDRDLFLTVVGTVDSLPFGGIGTVRNLLHVQGPPKAFAVGTSGSAFEVLNASTGNLEAAAVQVGADSDTAFRDGYGEALETALSITARELAKHLASAGKSLTNGRIDFVKTF